MVVFESNKIEVKSEIINQIFKMIEQNIIRTPKVVISQNDQGALGVEVADPSSQQEAEIIMLEESWSHIQPCYEILVRIMVCPYIPTQIIKETLTKNFMVKLFNLMNSPDPRERDYVKTLFY